MSTKTKIGLAVGISNFVAIILLMLSDIFLPQIPDAAFNVFSCIADILSLPLSPLFARFIEPQFSNYFTLSIIFIPWSLLNASIWGIGFVLLIKLFKKNK